MPLTDPGHGRRVPARRRPLVPGLPALRLPAFRLPALGALALLVGAVIWLAPALAAGTAGTARAGGTDAAYRAVAAARTAVVFRTTVAARSAVASRAAGTARTTAIAGTAGTTQMEQLAFLVGSWDCQLTVNMPDGTTAGNQVLLTIQPILGGSWLQVESLQLASESNPQRIQSNQVYGWDPLDQQFTTYYYDDQDGQGSGGSPGVVDGHFVVTGTYIFNGFRHLGRDDIVATDADHFVDSVAIALLSSPTDFFPVGIERCARRY